MITRILSGGQTGADRAALDWAIEHGIPHGGWCPKGRWAEDGPIDGRYQLQETPTGSTSANMSAAARRRMNLLQGKCLISGSSICRRRANPLLWNLAIFHPGCANCHTKRWQLSCHVAMR